MIERKRVLNVFNAAAKKKSDMAVEVEESVGGGRWTELILAKMMSSMRRIFDDASLDLIGLGRQRLQNVSFLLDGRKRGGGIAVIK